MRNRTGVELRPIRALRLLLCSDQSLHQIEGVIRGQIAVIAPLETGKVRWAHEVLGAYFCNLRRWRAQSCPCSPKIHGRNPEVSAFLMSNLLDVVLSTHDPTPKTLFRDGPEPCCCFQKISVSPEDTSCFGVVPIPEVRSKSH